MGSVCFIVDAMVTGEMLPRHLKSIRESGVADHLLPILVTATHAQERLSAIEQRYHTHSLITPVRPLGARLNKAASASQAEWLIIALQKKPLPSDLWGALYPQLNTYSLDALIIGFTQPSLPERILRRLLVSALIFPPYIAVRRAWLERLGGFDPELDDSRAIDDFLQRLHAFPTRLKSYSGHLLSQAEEPATRTLPNAPDTICTPRP
ncbi:glycosyltransferase family 2 protein [Halomonas sp. ISL-60]|uniref:glycosyltransferase family A protein n=1 Tax=Halomonas sp. ISL-56 TaxID=2819149 RepID=UPI001BE7AA39|nr:glycosyltransferase family A protein [Halomonas sp. ISL-56]MBT2774114.1 glycosyltransferase family 2 protein [Halomonas sp. ISL-60]MBT2800254.1 glycosyltransferase family 2 protein [Halomonas sp. ISL-56]